MASIYRDPSRNGWRCQFCLPNGLRRQLWLGDCSKTAASHFRRQLESLIASRALGAPPDPPIERWTKELSPRIAKQLVNWGLMVDATESSRKLSVWLAAYLKTRSDLTPRTMYLLEQASDRLQAMLPEDPHLSAVTPADADRISRTIRAQLSPATAGRELKRYRQLFNAAVRARVIDANPFESIDVGGKHMDRAFYLTPEDTESIIKQATCPEIRCVIALARYLGLRTPSEPQAILISDIDWHQKRIVIRSDKLHRHANHLRTVPIFPEAMPYLEQAYQAAPEGAEFLLNRYRSSANTHYRKQFQAAITRAGLKPWPKLWMNLRASCRTDLERRFPNHVCNAWLGQSSKVAERHYLQITETDWSQACGVAGGVIDS